MAEAVADMDAAAVIMVSIIVIETIETTESSIKNIQATEIRASLITNQIRNIHPLFKIKRSMEDIIRPRMLSIILHPSIIGLSKSKHTIIMGTRAGFMLHR